MSDIDFDELDQAISDLCDSLDDDFEDPDLDASATDNMASNTKHHVVKPSKKVVDIVGDGKNTETDNIVDAKPKGHFMDVVHPSSDVDVAHKTNLAGKRQAKINSHEIKAKKVAINVIDDNDDTEVHNNKRKVSIEISDDAKPNADPMPIRNDDGVDDANKAQKALAKHNNQSQKPPHKTTGRRGVQYATASVSTKRRGLAQPLPSDDGVNAMAEAVGNSSPDAYETPFLPNAKVTKRPLGGVKLQPKPVNPIVDDVAEQTKASNRAHPSRGDRADNSSRSRRNDVLDARDDVVVSSAKMPRSEISDSMQRSPEMRVRGTGAKVAHALGVLIVFVLIIGLGVLLGVAMYYYGG